MGFFETYFTDPIRLNTGYNVVNTFTYAIILLAAVFLTYKLLKKMKISIDNKFLLGVVPFVALGGILRAYEDMLEVVGTVQSLPGFLGNFIIVDAFGSVRNLILITPIIYITIFLAALAALAISILVQKYRKIEYWKTWFVIGIVADFLVLTQLRFSSVFGFVSVVLITAFWVVLFELVQIIAVKKKISTLQKLLTKENKFLILVHMFEATTTYVAIQFPEQLGTSYFEQHVVSGFFIGTLGAASFFLLKLIVVPIVLYYFDKEMPDAKDREKRTFLKIIVLILGLGPGLRNFLRLVMLV